MSRGVETELFEVKIAGELLGNSQGGEVESVSAMTGTQQQKFLARSRQHNRVQFGLKSTWLEKHSSARHKRLAFLHIDLHIRLWKGPRTFIRTYDSEFRSAGRFRELHDVLIKL